MATTTVTTALPEISYPFTSLTLEDARRVARHQFTATHAEYQSYWRGDHWRYGQGWVGPMPQPDEDGYLEAVREIERAFTSQNVVSEAIKRHMMGIVGREPGWFFAPRRFMREDEKPRPEEQALIDELEALLTDWWDERGVLELIQAMVTTTLYADHACARLYVPRGLLRTARRGDGVEVKVLKAADMREALSLIYIDHTPPDRSAVYTDPDTQRKLGAYHYRDTLANEWVEVCWLDPSGMTVVRQLGPQGRSSYFALNYGGRLPMYQMDRRALITPQVLQNQRALNLALSMSPRNVVTGGFLERVLLNAQMPGEWEVDEAGNRVRFIPGEYRTGSGTTNFLRGVDYQDEDGKTHLANPSVHWRDPVEVSPALEAKEAHKLAILDEVDQAHVLTTSSQYQSGKSKEQSRADFMASLGLTRGPVEGLGRWLLETAVAMAEQFIGEPGRYTAQLRAVFYAKPDYGPLSADEARMYNESLEKGVFSRERVQYLNGIDDMDAENTRINNERMGLLDSVEKQMRVLTAALNAGLPPQLAARKAGFTEEEIPEIVAGIEAEREREEAQMEEQARIKGFGSSQSSD